MKSYLESAEFSCLTADVGGTNVRFGVVDHSPETGARPQIREQRIYPCASFESIDVAMETYRKQIDQPMPEIACVAVAGPVKNNIVRMTNRDWLISGSELTSRFGFQEVMILNDAAAIAYATRVIGDTELKPVKKGQAIPDAPIAVITAGTGVGVAALVSYGGQWYPQASEAGHITLAPQTPIEVAVFENIDTETGRISAEQVLSGIGIRRLYLALGAVKGVLTDDLTPEEITQCAMDRTDQLCVEALKIYCNLLGTFAGDIALTFGARGGMYLAGNVMRQIEPMLTEDWQFRQSFENKQSMMHYLTDIPVNMITVPEPGMIGASAWFDHSVSARAQAAR